MMDILQINVAVAMLAAMGAVAIGVNIRELGVRVYTLVLITAMVVSSAVIDTWFITDSLVKCAAIGWFIGYVTDDFLLTLNAIMPKFIREIINKIFNGIKNKIDKWFS